LARVVVFFAPRLAGFFLAESALLGQLGSMQIFQGPLPVCTMTLGDPHGSQISVVGSS
jgi:hypothetical protein